MIFQQPVFSSPEWASYALSIQQAEIADQQAPASLLLQRAMPDLANLVMATQKALLHSGAKHQTQMQVMAAQLSRMEANLGIIMSGRLPLAINVVLGCSKSSSNVTKRRRADGGSRGSLDTGILFCTIFIFISILCNLL